MILQGRTLAQQIRSSLAQRAKNVSQKIARPLRLVAIGSSDDYAAYTYLQKEVAAAHEIGIETTLHPIHKDTPVKDFINLVKQSSRDPLTDSILIPRPLPEHLAMSDYASYLAPEKDIDGMSNVNMGNLFLCKTWEEITKLRGFVPATAMAVMKLLEFYNIDLPGKEVAVLGRSSTVGRPLAHLLTCKNATVKICHSYTDLPRAIKDADLVCSATGHAGLLNAAWFKPGSVLIDISTNWKNNHLVGDAMPEDLEKHNIHYSPVPGGVGPVTLAVLLENMVLSKERAL